jgi:hypothetical protein
MFAASYLLAITASGLDVTLLCPEVRFPGIHAARALGREAVIVGMLCVVMEETEGIIGERRPSMLRDLASDIAGKNVHAEMFGVIQRQLARRHERTPTGGGGTPTASQAQSSFYDGICARCPHARESS